MKKVKLTEKEEERLYGVMNDDNTWDKIQPVVEKMMTKRAKKFEKTRMWFQAKLWDLTIELEKERAEAKQLARENERLKRHGPACDCANDALMEAESELNAARKLLEKAEIMVYNLSGFIPNEALGSPEERTAARKTSDHWERNLREIFPLPLGHRYAGNMCSGFGGTVECEYIDFDTHETCGKSPAAHDPRLISLFPKEQNLD